MYFVCNGGFGVIEGFSWGASSSVVVVLAFLTLGGGGRCRRKGWGESERENEPGILFIVEDREASPSGWPAGLSTNNWAARCKFVNLA